MPPIKNWKKEAEMVYRYRPENEFRAILVELDGTWTLEIRFKETVVTKETIGEMGKTKARKGFTAWLMENPELPVRELKTEFRATVQNEPVDSEDIPANACVNFKECGNEAPGGDEAGNMMCDDCLDKARYNDREPIGDKDNTTHSFG